MIAAPELAPLASAAGVDLHAFRPDHVTDRVQRALAREKVATLPRLAGLLRTDAAARTRFRRSVAVSVSGLFRDSQQFDLLERELLPQLLELPGRLGVWSAGCADGSELSSVAILLERHGALERSSLLGSDLLEENLAPARRGAYDGVDVGPHLRRRARWEQRDVVAADAPAGAWALILCRNLAIYLTPVAKRVLHEKLGHALRPGGILMLGRSERLADPRSLGLERAAPHAYRRSR